MRIRAVWVHAMSARLRAALLQAALLAVTGVVCGVVFNAYRPGGIDWIGSWPSAGTTAGRAEAVGAIEIDEAWKRYQEGQVLFVDARSTSEYRPAHLPGAVNVPVESAGKGLDELERAVDSGKELVVYCSGPECSLSSDVASILTNKGFRNVTILSGGWSEWLDAGFPIEENGGN